MVQLSVAPNGRVVIPAEMRAALGCQSGGKLLARLENGVLLLEPVDVAVRRAQEMVRRYVPAGAELTAELLAERRDAAQHE
jgi:antitoxin PrlF